MRLLIVSDVHDLSGFENVYDAINKEHPDVLLSCGDWGSYLPAQRKAVLKHYSEDFLALTSYSFRALFDPILSAVIMFTLYGNHDVLDDLRRLRNCDGSQCLLPTMTPVKIKDLSILAINGNFARKKRCEWHITAEELRQGYLQLRKNKTNVDTVLSHEAVAGYADSDKGQPLLTEICDDLAPRYWFSGHIHRAAQFTTSRTVVVNIGMTLHADYALLDTDAEKLVMRVRNGPRQA